MGHNLNEVNGKVSLMTKVKPWHGLGQIVEQAQTSEEAIKLAGLDYDVVKQPVFLQDGTQIPSKFATVRQDTNVPFGVVGRKYEILQNIEAFDFFDSIIGSKEAIFETAGAIGDGERVFITAKLPDYIKVGNGDQDLIEKYLFLTNTHDGSKPVTAAFTPIAIVCENTLNAALSNMSNQITLKHTKNVANKVKEAHKLMGIVNLLSKELNEVFNMMAKKPLVDKQLREIIVKTFASPANLNKLAEESEFSTKFTNVIDAVMQYALEDSTQQIDTRRGTVFGAYNAVTGYLHNVKNIDDRDSEDHLKSIISGTNALYTQKAFDLCLAEIK